MWWYFFRYCLSKDTNSILKFFKNIASKTFKFTYWLVSLSSHFIILNRADLKGQIFQVYLSSHIKLIWHCFNVLLLSRKTSLCLQIHCNGVWSSFISCYLLFSVPLIPFLLGPWMHVPVFIFMTTTYSNCFIALLILIISRVFVLFV